MRMRHDGVFRSQRPGPEGARGPRGEGREFGGEGRRRHGGSAGPGQHGGSGEHRPGGAEERGERGERRDSERVPGGGRRGGHGLGPALERGFGGRGRRARRGDVRAAILSLLADGPTNGYGLIKAIAEKSGDAWRPSPGSVYPTLAQLVDEQLIIPSSIDGPRSDYQLTDAGRTYVSEHAAEITGAWAGFTKDQDELSELIAAAAKLMGAIRQFSTDATAEQRHNAATKLDELRRELYRILGE